MSASARTHMSFLEKMNDAKIHRDSAVEHCEKKNYFSAYRAYSKALGCFTDDDVEQEPAVQELLTEVKHQMEQIGKLGILEVRLSFNEINPRAFDPFCACTYGKAHEHWCDYCAPDKTILDLFNWEKAKLEREVSLANLVKRKRKKAGELLEKSKQMRKELELLDEEMSLANLVKIERKNALELLEKAEQMRKELELLSEEVKCTLREARYAQEELEESRGW